MQRKPENVGESGECRRIWRMQNVNVSGECSGNENLVEIGEYRKNRRLQENVLETEECRGNWRMQRNQVNVVETRMQGKLKNVVDAGK